ncbi:PE-PPE domain-containing protein [Mycobacterium sp. THU-M104]|uniref:PE-PPE domain-containing protein n=1 Tax=Mycobacterium sp. THU-M104 TaxID=3410515 RepID=UPI003B998BDA
MAAAGIPIPPTEYIDNTFTKFLEPLYPALGNTPPAVGLFTPEGLYPVYSEPGPGGSLVKQLPFETSVYQGEKILDKTILNDVHNLGDTVVVYGESQSATISGLSMADLAGKVPSDSVHFVLVGDPDTPFGGLLTRFAASDVPGLLRPELTTPSIGVPFYGATPDDLFPTTIYTQQCDGFADFPRYPLDFLSDLNAFLGIEDVNPTYRDLSTTAISNATQLPTSGDTMTTYYGIPMSMEAGLNSQYIPLMQPVADIPVIGKPIADLLQLDVIALVNFGYGSPYWGFSVGGPDGGYANATQPFGLFPSLQDFQQLPGALFTGTETGIEDCVGDLTGTGPHPVSLGSAALPDLATMV